MSKRYLFLILLLILTVSGCSTNYRTENVRKEFPDADIAFIPNHGNSFIVRMKDGSVWYVKCDYPFSGKVTSKSMIFTPIKAE